MSDLKPCPYCGGEASHRAYTDAYELEKHNIECANCGAEAGYGDCTGGLSWSSKDKAFKAWNNRAQPTISDYLEANKEMIEKTRCKVVTIESLKRFVEGEL